MLNSCVVNLKVGPVSSYTLKKQVGCFNHRVVALVAIMYGLCVQGRRKQSADGQAQLDVSGEVANYSRAKRAAKFWT